MFKKVLTLLAGVSFSLSASAGYVQYNFSGPVTGYVVQHDDDQSIAYYYLNVPLGNLPVSVTFHAEPFVGVGTDVIVSETTYYRQVAPTDFTIHDNFGTPGPLALSFNFVPHANDVFDYTTRYSGSVGLYIGLEKEYFPTQGALRGIVTKGLVDPDLARSLDDAGGYYAGVPAITPDYRGPADVPEPASLALLAAGALGAAGVTRRRKRIR